jgi:hypothetical protein
MAEAVEYVRQHPGCSIAPAARAIGPYGSTMYGYRAVHRAIKAGLISAVRTANKYVLTIPESSCDLM